MAWIYSPELVGSPWLLSPGSEPSPIARATHTLKASCCPECGTAFLREHPSGTMCAPCDASISAQVSTSSLAASHARTSVLRALGRAWTEADRGYFSRSSDSLANFDPDSFSWKTSQLSLFGGLTEFSWSSLRWGSIVDGRLYQPQRWEPRTFESDGGCLPTPTATEYGSSLNGTRDGVTPYNGAGKPSLSTLARRIPSPRATDGSKSGVEMKDGTPTLQELARRLPTPAARDGKDGWTPKKHGRHSSSVAVAVAGHRGFLNPRFVEVLMGLPIGWTRLEDWATQWFLKQRGKRSKDLEVSND